MKNILQKLKNGLILLLKGIAILSFILIVHSCSSGDVKDSDNYKKGYQDGYSVGHDDGVTEICQSCHDNAENDYQDGLCTDICG